jgi:hypothetical protein
VECEVSGRVERGEVVPDDAAVDVVVALLLVEAFDTRRSPLASTSSRAARRAFGLRMTFGAGVSRSTSASSSGTASCASARNTATDSAHSGNRAITAPSERSTV